MNKVMSFLDEISTKLKEYEKEIEKENLLTGIKTKDEVLFDNQKYILSIVSKYNSYSFLELQNDIHQYILPIRNRLSSNIKNWLFKKKYNIIYLKKNKTNIDLRNNFIIRFLLTRPLPIKNFLYKVYNEYKIPENVKKNIGEKLNIDISHFDVVCHFLLHKQENEHVECGLHIENKGLDEKEISKIKNNYQEVLYHIILGNREILFYWLKEYINLTREIVEKKVGLTTLVFYCQQELVMVWSVMIDGHIKVKMHKPIKYKMTFKGFKKNYYSFLEEFFSGRKEKKYTSEFYKHLTNMEKIFLFELENVKKNYCFEKKQNKKIEVIEKIFDNLKTIFNRM